MDLRLAEYKDYERIAHLHAESWKRHYQGILSSSYLDKDALDDKMLIWQTRLTNPPFNQHIVLAEEGGLLIGFVCIFGNHDFERGTFIDALHVDDAFRSRGIGKQLLLAAAEWQQQFFKDSGLYLEVVSQNTSAIEFYRHIGGRECQERIWRAPGGTEVMEKGFSWPSAQALVNGIEDHVVYS
ncbi:GNAT family N-acetyltransferase [Vibrio natriegens]|uniref:GNAT family N-acetyltransferase n=1 Tax=Vibrio natriegens TaxID=691 RepID=UPI000357E43D|nr:GNAT family N-acetyltransferase [Vibrio natriegens]EPM40172.1 histone acetyltransferase [Vibrio natriegens NBRC 15636 = ATCC 14048 = DSM 759]